MSPSVQTDGTFLRATVDSYHGKTDWQPTGPVGAAALSPNGCFVLSGHDDSSLRLWELSTGRELKRFHGYNREVSCVGFSPDGRRAVSGGYCYYGPGDRALPPNLRVWDLESGSELCGESVHTWVASVGYSPDGKWLLSSGDDRYPRLARAEDAQEVRSFVGHAASYCVSAFLPDGRRMLSGGFDRTLRLWNVETGEPLAVLRGHSSGVTCLAVSADGRTAVSGSKDKSVRLWDLEDSQEVACWWGHKNRVTGVAIAPDGRWALSCGWDKTIRIWEIPRRRP